jgi:glucose-1-phosphate thymidylyltransferase
VKGVILAGGTGSRLFPLTKVTNKHLLPVGRYPMIYHPVAKLVEAGIRDILIVTGTEHMGAVVGTLGSGAQLGVHFTYKVQDQAGGIAQALGLAEDFVGSERFVVILGDNIFEDSITPFVERFVAQCSGARVLLKEVADPHRFGVVEIIGGRIVNIVEKPLAPKSHYIVTGIYMYDAFAMQAIRRLQPSARGELEITDVNNAYAKCNRLFYDILPGWWTDAGTPSSLALANQLAANVSLPLFDQSTTHGVPTPSAAEDTGTESQV